MSDQPETLATILAEMRAAAKSTDLFDVEEVGEPLIRGTKVEEWADRIEAAAERKRATLEDALAHCKQYAQKIERENEEGETRLDAEEIIATVDNEFAGIRPAPATGNSAAMRKAVSNAVCWLSGMLQFCDRRCTGEEIRVPAYSAFGTIDRLRAALAAPARNCDRFATADDARRAFQDLRGHKILADVELWDSMDEAGALVRWLFAPAEGGDHA